MGAPLWETHMNPRSAFVTQGALSESYRAARITASIIDAVIEYARRLMAGGVPQRG